MKQFCLRRQKRSGPWSVLVLLGYLALTLFVFRHWLPLFSSHIAGDEKDGVLTFFQAWWPYHALHHPAAYLDGPAFALVQQALPFSDMMPGLLPLFALLKWFSGNEILIYNICHLFFFWLIQVCLFYRFHQESRNLAVGFLAGCLGFAPFFMDQLLHFQLVFVAPLILLPVWYRKMLWQTGRSFFWITLTLCWLGGVSVHLALFGCIYLFYHWLFDRQRWLRLGRMRLKHLPLLLGGAGVMALALWPYYTTSAYYGLTRLKIEAIAGAITLADFFRSPPAAVHEKALYLHPVWVVAFCLVCAALWRMQKRRVLLALLLLWTALGPLPDLAGLKLPHLSPYNLLYEVLPGMDRIRASSRIAVLFLVELAGLAALLPFILARWSERVLRLWGTPLFQGSSEVRARRVADSRWLRFLAHASGGLLLLYGSFAMLERNFQPRFDLHSALVQFRQLAAPLRPAPSEWLWPASEWRLLSAWNKIQQSRLQADSSAFQALLQIDAMQSGYFIASGYTGIRVDPALYHEEAVKHCGQGAWSAAACQEFEAILKRMALSRNTGTSAHLSELSEPQKPQLLPGDFQIQPRVRRGLALLILFQARRENSSNDPVDPVWTSESFLFHDRRLLVEYYGPLPQRVQEWQGPMSGKMQQDLESVAAQQSESMPLSSPPFRVAENVAFLHAVAAPQKRGDYRVRLKEDEAIILESELEIY